MKKLQKSILALAMITVFMTGAPFLPGLISAGNLDPSDPPDSTMHTLEEIYNKIDSVTCEKAFVEKTGQISSYATGDDGDLKKGFGWPVPRFTDNSDGTVTDNLTGLIWLKNANCGGDMNWADAISPS